MLLRFKFSNFRSFRDEQEFSMVASSLSELPGNVIETKAVPEGVLPVAAIYGANASGKSNLLKALEFVFGAVLGSFQEWWKPGIFAAPFLLDHDFRSAHSSVVVDFLVSRIRYTFGMVVDDGQVHEEWLHAFPGGRRQLWYHRRKGHPVQFGRNLAGENRIVERITRPDALFLSTAAASNHAQLRAIYDWFVLFPCVDSNLVRVYRDWHLDRKLKNSSEYGKELGALLQKADLGITEVRLRADQEKSVKLDFLHSGARGTALLPEDAQSEGTMAFLGLLLAAQRALSIRGGVMLVDELDRSLSPLLAREFIRMFTSRETNPHGAQLIFTTHNTSLLSSDLLRRDQIWFTEKDRHGASRLYPLTDFRPRKGENIENGYLKGRYGAVPFIDPGSFREAVAAAIKTPTPAAQPLRKQARRGKK